MDARPDVAEVLFGDVPGGQGAQTDVGSITEALLDPDGVAGAVLRLSRTAVQVLMALVDAAEWDYGGLRDRFGGPGFADLAHRGADWIGAAEVIRVLSMAGGAVEVDPHSARAALCEPLAAAARPAAMEEFDRILVRLTDSCLVWPESGGRSFRIHDAVMDARDRDRGRQTRRRTGDGPCCAPPRCAPHRRHRTGRGRAPAGGTQRAVIRRISAVRSQSGRCGDSDRGRPAQSFG